MDRTPSSSSSTSSSRNRNIISRITSHSMNISERTPERSNDNSISNLSESTDNYDQHSRNLSAESKPKLSNSEKYKAKVVEARPFLGFELELKPIRRSVLNLDVRFFPTGLHPGMMVELKGEEGTGKTLLITYLLARVVVSSPTKTALLIDTAHHFNNRILINMISHFDQDIKFDKDDYSLQNCDIIQANPKLSQYLERIATIKCCNAADLLVTVGPNNDSTVEKMILADPNLSLVAVDRVDNYSGIANLKGVYEKQPPNILQLIRQAVAPTQTPVICATMMLGPQLNTSKDKIPNMDEISKSERFRPSLTAFVPQEASESEAMITDEPVQQDPDSFCYFIMDYSLFTHNMYLQKIECNENIADKKMNHLRSAHLRSKQSPKTALFSVVNHRAKFSIFSDMLYVEG